jgi:Fe-S-cluster containining protein
MINALQRVRSLSIHADYRCRHSGVCCSSHWDVPVELPVYTSLGEAVAAGRLQPAPASTGLDPFVVEPDLPDEAAAMLERNDDGECVFFERGSHLCVVHRELGEGALPATCRHFPRVAVRDARGTAIGLSHYCPTAAEMLFRDDVELSVVDAPPAFPPADYEGLVVTVDDVPPLLRPGVVMDLEAYDAWERHMVQRCATASTAESAVATLERDAMLMRAWTPDGPPMVALVARLPPGHVAVPAPTSVADNLEIHRHTLMAAPDDLRPARDDVGLDEAYRDLVAPSWPSWSLPLRRYVAAKAFASWTAYQGMGLLSIVRGLEVALALVRVEAARQCRDATRALDRPLLHAAFRQADFILNHLAVGEDLATEWSHAEQDRGRWTADRRRET